jgi:hypothetical protein
MAYLALIIEKFLLVLDQRTFYRGCGMAVVRLALVKWAAVRKGGHD